MGVTGSEDHPRAPGHVELGPRCIGEHVGGAPDAECPVGGHGGEDHQEARVARVERPAALVVKAPGMGDHRHLKLVGPQVHAQVQTRPLGKAHVIEVGVGEDHGLDVAG